MPSSKILVVSAVAISVSASAALAAATEVNIVDPTKASRAAQVEIGNRLAVQEVPPASFYHASYIAVSQGGSCSRIAGAPTGKALIVRQVRINTGSFGNTPGGGPDHTLYLYANSNCDDLGQVGSVTLSGVGLTTVTFDPGVAVPMGYGFSAQIVSTTVIYANAYVDGYAVPANVAPVVGQIIEQAGSRHSR